MRLSPFVPSSDTRTSLPSSAIPCGTDGKVATVETVPVLGTTLRTAMLSESATYTLPAPSIRIAFGLKNAAAAPTPSTSADIDGSPATVETVPALTSSMRMELLSVSAM